jgi:hypothetical protein
MRMKRTKRIRAFIRRFSGAAKLVLLFQITVPGAALCLEADGGASVENYVNGLCADSAAALHGTEESHETFHSLECGHEAHCVECVDIPLSEKLTGKKAHGQNDADAQISAHMLAVTITYAAPRPPALTGVIPIPSGHPKAKTKAFIKSTVLVC